MLAELATTAATGHDRAQILWHVLDCPTCQHDLAELARTADELLLLAPQRQPPAGFDTAVVQRIQDLMAARVPDRTTTEGRLKAAIRRLLPRGTVGPAHLPAGALRAARRALAGAVALVLAGFVGAGIVLWRTAPDRQLADEYRHGLIVGSGQAPRSAPVTTDAGVAVGHVYLFPGTPAWILVAITAAPQPGGYTMSVVTTAGVRYYAGVCQVTGQVGTAGYPLPVAVNQVALIEMTRPGIRLDVHL
jgi:hypothetical protein